MNGKQQLQEFVQEGKTWCIQKFNLVGEEEEEEEHKDVFKSHQP